MSDGQHAVRLHCPTEQFRRALMRALRMPIGQCRATVLKQRAIEDLNNLATHAVSVARLRSRCACRFGRYGKASSPGSFHWPSLPGGDEPEPSASVPPVSLATRRDCWSRKRAAQTATAQAPATIIIDGMSIKMNVRKSVMPRPAGSPRRPHRRAQVDRSTLQARPNT